MYKKRQRYNGPADSKRDRVESGLRSVHKSNGSTHQRHHGRSEVNYKVVKENSSYNIVETQTDQVVKTFNNQEDAKKLMKQLNLGGGFDGWTPTFFTKNLQNSSQGS